MSRERPMEPPRVIPDARKPKPETHRQMHARMHLEALKREHGPGFFGALAAKFGNTMPRVKFIRRGYEASIVDNLRDFFKGRGWRMKHQRSGATWKERMKANRRAATLRAGK